MLAAWILMSSAMLRDQRANTTLVMVDFSKDDIEPDAPAKPVEVAPVPDVTPVRLESNSKLAARESKVVLPTIRERAGLAPVSRVAWLG